MDDWLDRFADALHVPRLDPAEVDSLLDLARIVAHGTERRNAPLAAYLAGRAAGTGGTGPAAARSTAEGLLGGASKGDGADRGGGATRPGS